MQLHSNMYVVQAGETVESIAYRYQLTPTELESLNPGLSSTITSGMRINVRPGTVLSSAVRSRSKTALGGIQQPQLVSEQQARQLRPQQQVIANNQVPNNQVNEQVVLVPTPVTPAIVSQPIGQAANERVITEPANRVITEIPATSWSNEQVVVAEGNFTEEVVPDTLDYEPVAANRAAMNEQLQQFVGEWAWPTEGQVAREFAPGEVNGQGVDIAGVPGQNIHAAMAGTVVYSGRDLSGGGNLIIVRHDDSLMTTYSHADQLFVAEDDQVVAGDPIASLGWNANRESVLRFEVRKDGNPLDPMKFLPLR